jgi:hypothetical protein
MPRYRKQAPMTFGPTLWQQMWAVLDDRNREAVCLCWREDEAQRIADALNAAERKRRRALA